MKLRHNILTSVVVCLLMLSAQANAESILAARTIHAKRIISNDDLAWVVERIPNALDNADDAVGLEAKVTIYQGRPIRASDLGPPALVERNQLVSLKYSHLGLTILTEGRVLDRAALGESVRVMNLQSRITVVGQVTGPALVAVR